MVSANGKNTPLDGRFDVVVCGGGPAGLCAAVSAARLGARTALIERYGYLGGTATAGMVTPISEYNKGGKRVIGGIPWEFALRLARSGGAKLDYYNGNVPFDQEVYKLEAQRMVLEAGVQPVMNTWVSGVSHEAGRLISAGIVNKSGSYQVRGEVFIDCTGDADLAWAAGAPMQPREGGLQPLTLWFRLGGVDTPQVSGMRLDGENVSGHNQAVRSFLEGSGAAGCFGGPWFFEGPAPDIVNVNMTRAAGDASDWESYQRASFELREDVFRLVALLKQGVPAFKNAYLLDTAAMAGVRETRRLLGVHTVTGEELSACMRYPDSIARGAHPMDMHDAHSAGQKLTGFEEAYYIPYRCMITGGFPNLLAAGRCVSATREAQSTMRVQAPCMAEGEAAGTAAAMCVRDSLSVHKLDTGLLRQTLTARGAIV